MLSARGWVVTSYIWYSTDVHAEWPPFSALLQTAIWGNNESHDETLRIRAMKTDWLSARICEQRGSRSGLQPMGIDWSSSWTARL